MDWHKLYFGHMNPKEVAICVSDATWQGVRMTMKGQSLRFKYDTLLSWLEINHYSRAAKVQVTNYVTALSRGGLIHPEDYR